MAAFQYSDCTNTLSSGGWITITTTSSTSCTNVTRYSPRTMVYHQYEYVSYAEPPAVPPEYLKLRQMVLYRDCREAQVSGGRPDVPQARGKLTRWKSLKEKRRAWA